MTGTFVSDVILKHSRSVPPVQYILGIVRSSGCLAVVQFSGQNTGSSSEEPLV